MLERLSYDHIPPGTPLEEADAETAWVDTFGGGEAVLLELQDGTRLVFRGPELLALLEPQRVERAA